jgi:hypothetical protein
VVTVTLQLDLEGAWEGGGAKYLGEMLSGKASEMTLVVDETRFKVIQTRVIRIDGLPFDGS